MAVALSLVCPAARRRLLSPTSLSPWPLTNRRLSAGSSWEPRPPPLGHHSPQGRHCLKPPSRMGSPEKSERVLKSDLKALSMMT